MKEIKLIRLVSGEEIIAEISPVENTKDTLIKDAIVLIPAGEGKIGIMPFMPYTKAKNGLTLRDKDIMFMVEPVEDLVAQFTTARSGIVTAPKRILS
jgi:hypothetical protein|tara:strand:- start:390 stop:680 length:291 start_codon:yes stop_codon:yes gene_type:complete